MTFEDAIHEQYGVRIPRTAPDLKLRKFRIDDLRNGFIVKSHDSGVFGSIIDGETFIWSDDRVSFQKKEHKANKAIRFEWLIWEGARYVFERGERLNQEDRERLALAVKRLEDWL